MSSKSFSVIHCYVTLTFPILCETVMKRTSRMTLERQQKWFDAHRRSIELDDVVYEPFWRVEDVRSFGNVTKIAHFFTPNRVMHLLSQNELWMYLNLARDRNVVEIYEQYAIPLDYSIPIAKELGVKHPVYVGSKQIPIVQTIDFVSTLADGSLVAHPVKQESDSLRERTMEKLAIQQAYCDLECIEYQLVTSDELRTIRSENLENIYRHRNAGQFVEHLFRSWLTHLASHLSDNRHERMSTLLQHSAVSSGIDFSTAVSLFYAALWNEQLEMDWGQRLKLEKPASILGVYTL